MLNGPVTIGTNGSTVSTLVQLEAPQQIASNSPLTVADGGALDLGGYSQTVASLTLDGGGVEFGTLILKGNLTAQNGIDEPVFFIADLSLGGANRSLTVNAGSTFTIFGGIIDGGNNAGFTKAGTGELVLEGSGTYGGIASVNAGILLVEDGGALGGISASTVVAPGAEIDLTDQVFVDAEPLSIAGAGVDGLGALKGSGTNSWAGPITLTGSTVVEIASNGLTQFGGVLSGNSGSTLTMSGPGTLEYNGNSANTLAGSTSVSHGLLLLSKTNAIALPASLSVGASTYLGPNSEVRLLAPNQIGSAAQVTITDNGLLNLNNFSSPIGPLTLNGGIVETGSGLLTLNGNVAVDGTQTGNPIYGFVSLGGATRTFNCAPAGVCYIFACLSDGGNNAGLIVTGTGELFLGGSNSFNGTAVVSNGLLGVLNNYALGTINGGTVVTNGGTLYVAAGVNVGLEPLTLSGGGGTWAGALQSYGTNSWAGPVTLAAQTSIDVQAPGPLTLSGAISGPGGLQTIDAGILKLANTQPNTYAGPTIVNDGVLELAAVNGSAVPGPLTVNTYSSPNLFTNTVRWLGGNYQVSTNVTITLNTNTLMDLNNNTDAIGSLTGGGSLNLGTGSLIIGVNNTSNVFSGPITGQSSSSLVKSGSGTLTLAGNSAGLFTGLATVVTGQLLVTGSMPQATIDLDGGTLGGFGTVGPIGQAFYGGYVNPGGPGTLNSGTLTLTSKSTFMAALNGPPGGTNYSQINVTGGVSLGGAVLQLSVGIAGASNNQYILINNDGAGAGAVSGTFAGLAEGATLTANNGAHFAISYHGGAGKDVVLTQTSAPAPPKFSGIVKLAGGSIELSGSGATNVSYTVLASTNLSTTNWISIGTTGANGTGSFQFIDSNAPNFPHRFYILSGP
jgi:autotransporter-associated beta strand protein